MAENKKDYKDYRKLAEALGALLGEITVTCPRCGRPGRLDVISVRGYTYIVVRHGKSTHTVNSIHDVASQLCAELRRRLEALRELCGGP